MNDDEEIPLGLPYVPLLSQKAIDYFETLLTPDSLVYEYGSGRSTIWLAQRARQVVSVENFPGWFRFVKRALDELDLQVDLRLFSPETMGSPQAAEEAYNAFIQKFPDGYFDLIYLDGWRPSRISAPSFAKQKVKPFGWLVIDDLEWSPVTNGIKSANIEAWEVSRCHGPVIGFIPGITDGPPVSHTGFYQRPQEAPDAKA